MSARVKEPTSHLVAHFVLLLGIFLSGGLSLILVKDRMINLGVLIILSALYITWGIWHHHEHNNLTKNVVLEYIGVTSIIILVYLLIS